MTEKQQQALDFIRSKQRIVAVGPTLRELADALGCVPNGAQQKVDALRRKGLVAPSNGRGLVLTSAAAEAPAPRKPILKPSGRL